MRFAILYGRYGNFGEKKYFPFSQKEIFIGGFDPKENRAEEWYSLVDTTYWNTLSGSSDFDKILKLLCRYVEDGFYVKESDKLSAPSTRALNKLIYEEFGCYKEKIVKKAYERAEENAPEIGSISFSLFNDTGEKSVAKKIYFEEFREKIEIVDKPSMVILE